MLPPFFYAKQSAMPKAYDGSRRRKLMAIGAEAHRGYGKTAEVIRRTESL